MKFRILVGLVVNFGFMVMIAASEDTVESLMKKTVDFDAFIIYAEDVLHMLKQLQQMIPKENSPVHYDLENLISFSVMRPEKCSTKFNEQHQWFREPNNVSSPNRDKYWGPNILNYFTYFKVKSFEYCIKELEKNVKRISDDDLKKIQKISNFINPKGFKSVIKVLNLERSDIFAGIAKYLKDSDKSFDLEMQKAKTRDEAHDKYRKDLPIFCDRILENIKPIEFVRIANSEKDFPKCFLDDKFLAEWSINYRICSNVIVTSIEDFDQLYFGKKGIPKERRPFFQYVPFGGGYSGSRVRIV